MYQKIIWIIGFLFFGALPAFEDIKSEILRLEKEIDLQGDEGTSYVKLAQFYWKDQDPEKAFTTYLKALSHAPKIEVPPSTKEELELYNQGLEIYLGVNQGESPLEIGMKLREKYSPILNEHPDYLLLNFLVASGLANSALFEDFFESFYRSYKAYPDHYLAYKNKALLHLKIYERSRTLEEKESQRLFLIDNLMKALQKNNRDRGLYKLIMVFASEKEQPDLVESGLNKIVNDNMIVPRGDVAFFVQQAIAVKKYDAAQRFLNKAREWYPVSRVIDASQNYLDQKR